MAIQLQTINNSLADRGVKERLTKGIGYFYFSEGDAASWKQSGVYVNKLNALKLGEWLNEWKDLSGNTKFPLEKKS